MPRKSKKKRGDVRTSAYVAKGNTPKVGVAIGYYEHQVGLDEKKLETRPILSAGAVHVGLEVWVLGVCPGLRKWFVLRNGALAEWKARRVAHKVGDPSGLDSRAKEAWAHALAREFLDVATHASEREVLGPVATAYARLCLTLTHNAVTQCAAVGVERDEEAFAHGVSVEWDKWDLMRPRYPSIQHAIYTSLVLALPTDEASVLIEHAAAYELRIPVVSKEVARAMYAQARSLLTKLVYAYWTQGVATDWRALGTDITRVFRAQFVRVTQEAADKGMPLESLAGFARQRGQTGDRATWNYLSPSDQIDPDQS